MEAGDSGGHYSTFVNHYSIRACTAPDAKTNFPDATFHGHVTSEMVYPGCAGTVLLITLAGFHMPYTRFCRSRGQRGSTRRHRPLSCRLWSKLR
jgi:hypothetical protein